MNSSSSRRRTRNQWDEFYKNYHNELKAKAQNNDNDETRRKSKNGLRNVVDDSESNGVKSAGVVHEETNVKQGESSGVRSVRRKIIEEDSRGKSKSDVKSKNDGDDVEYMGEKVVSRLGSRRRNADDSDSRGGFRRNDVSVDTEDSATSSDELVDLVSSSSEDKDTSDSEYEEDESSRSDESDSSNYCLSDRNGAYDSDGSGYSPLNGEVEKMTDKIDERKKHYDRKNGKKEFEVELVTDDESDEDSRGDDDGSTRSKRCATRGEQERVVIIIDDNEKSPVVRRSPRFSRSNIAQATDSETDENYHEDIGRSIHNSTSVGKGESEVKFPSSGKNHRVNGSNKAHHDSSKGGLKKRMFRESETVVDFDKSNGIEARFREKCHRPCSISMSQKKDSELKFSSLFSTPDSAKQKRSQQGAQEAMKKRIKKTPAERNFDMIKILLDSIDSLKGEVNPPTEESAVKEQPLPLKFRFEDEVQPPPEKSEWQKMVDSLYVDLELGLLESEIDFTNASATKTDGTVPKEIDNSPEACCGRGDHQPIRDEQIGIMCRHCGVLLLAIQDVLPDFYTPPLRRSDRKAFEESPCPVFGEIPFQDSARGPPDPYIHAEGTVWDLVSGVEKEMFPHQREGFEFMWKNIAGDINMENLKRPFSHDGRGCIISHAPGTGKSRMTIVFLMSFLKLYPTSRPVIVAPRGMLLTWEAEFIKWKVDVAFHNLNSMELSGNEIRIAAESTGQIGTVGMSKDYIRLLKVYSWLRGRSVLGISYKLFENIVGENGKKGDIMRKIGKELCAEAGILVLDEGHTPRNDQSLIWKALMKVSTQQRIILSGTPFQNNFDELYNTLCLVNPKFANQIGSQNQQRHYESGGKRTKVIRKEWRDFTSTIDKDGGRLKKIRDMLDPFVHLHKGTILQQSLPGLRDTIVFLHPTELQKTLLKVADEHEHLRRIHLVSLISVHPSMVAKKKSFSPHKNKLESIELVLDEGVKIKFVMNLISLAGALGERVLIFSQFIRPLVFIKKMLKSHFAWNQGQEILYMDGKLDERQRQESISSLNDPSSAAKVLLASEKACSEGINLVGASRVVLLDTVWNPSVERQAISRAYRLGQKRVVYVYRLIISGTEIRQYESQTQKDRISQLIFSPADGKSCGKDASEAVAEDKILDSMHNNESLRHIFEKTIHQPKESDLIETFGFVDCS